VRLFEIIDDPSHEQLFIITEYVKKGSLAMKMEKG